MKILFIGDIVAKPGRNAVKKVLPGVIDEYKPDLVIANAENLAHGRGATTGTIKEMQDVGINFFTGGDHLFWHRGFEDEVDELPIIRPANYPEQMPAKGFEIVDVGSKGKVLVINVMGQTFVSETLNNPFKAVDEILDSVDEDISAVVVDFHAEATSDKHAMGFYLDGRVDLVVGTHTHVPTCDERVFPKGTMFVSDVGMSGNVDSVLGVESHIIVDRMVNGKKAKFEWEEKGRTAFRSILADTEKKEIIRVDKNLW